MPFNILLLPILGGYYFISNHYYYKFKLQRLDSQKLLFDSILVGVLFSIISYIIIASIQFLLPNVSVKIESILPIKEDFLGTGILSFLLGIVSAHTLNLFSTEEEALRKAVEKWGDELDRLFLNSMIDKEQLMLSLKSGKIYIGFVVEVSEPGKVKYYSLLPTLSGYRSLEEHNVKITTNYSSVFDIQEEITPVLTYINANDILSVRKFESDIFNKFSNS